MSWQVISLMDTLPSPWRNGGGVTRELLAWPGTQDWIWRMSVAEVASNGPFSRFEGVRRWFAVLAGAGVRLTAGGQAHVLTCASAPLCFDGAVPVDCQLLEGATQDFNLMVRSDKASAQMRRISGQFSLTLDAPKTIAIYPMDTWTRVLFNDESLVVPARSLAWRALPAGARLQVSAGQALWMEIDVCA